jgi:hypothetical protein
VTNENNVSDTNTVVSTQSSYMSSYAKLNPDSNNYVTAQTGYEIYKPSDSVKISGSIWTGLVNLVGGAYLATVPVSSVDGNSVTELVLVKLKDPNGNIVYTKETQVDNNGDYVVPVSLPENATGKYSVESSLETKAGLVSTLDASTAAKLDSSTSFLVMTPDEFSVATRDGNFNVGISSNSTVSDFSFDSQSKTISFNVQGETGTRGVSDIVVPKSLLGGQIQVMVDGTMEPYNSAGVVVVSDTPSETALEINYHHSMHTIQLIGTSAAEMPVSSQAVPEFSSLAPVVLVISIASMIFVYPKLRLGKV